MDSVKELHIKVASAINHIDSNRKQSILPEYIDMALNEGLLQLINNKTSKKGNAKQEGFEDSIKRMDDLESLKKTISLTPRIETNSSSFILKPHDYLRGTELEVSIAYDKTFITPVTKTGNIHLYIINIPMDFTGVVTSGRTRYYNDFRFVFGSFDYSFDASTNNKYPIYSPEGRFMIIKDLLDSLRISGYKATFEYYDNIYYKNCICIEAENIVNDVDIYSSYAGYTSKTHNHILYPYTTYNTIVNRDSACELVSSEFFSDIKSNSYYSKNRQAKVIATMKGNRFYFLRSNAFTINDVKLTYLASPISYNLAKEQQPNIPFTDELYNLVVAKLKSYLLHEGYNIQKNENLIIE